MELNKVRQAFEYCLTPERGCLVCPAYISGAKPCYVWNEALFYLNEYVASLHNEPLTWSELQQMVGKPIWVEVLDEYGDHYKWHGTKYYIVKEFSKGFYGEYCHLEPNERTFTKSAYGDTWRAYRKGRE